MQNHNLGIKRGIAQGSVYSGESNATLRLQTVVIRRNRPISISLILNINIFRIQKKTQSRIAPITQAKNDGKRENKTLMSSLNGKSYHSLQNKRG
jgi:hypothetical protein